MSDRRPVTVHDDDLLERATVALRGSARGMAPTAEALAAAAEAACDAEQSVHFVTLGRTPSMRFASKLAAAILLAIGGVLLYWSLSKPAIAFADVARRVGQARTLQFRMCEPSLPGADPINLKVQVSD